MFWWVELHHGSPVMKFFAVHLFEPNAFADGEPFPIFAHRDEVFVFEDRPESTTTRFVDPSHRIGLSKMSERSVGDASNVSVVRHNIGVEVAVIIMQHVQSHRLALRSFGAER